MVTMTITPGTGTNDNDIDVKECPNCKSLIILGDNRLLRELCGHLICTRCVTTVTQCSQCSKVEQTGSPAERPSSGNADKVKKSKAVPVPVPDDITVMPGDPDNMSPGTNDIDMKDVKECPNCKSHLILEDNRPLRERCGHMICGRCETAGTQCSRCSNSKTEQTGSPDPEKKGKRHSSGNSEKVMKRRKAVHVPVPDDITVISGDPEENDKKVKIRRNPIIIPDYITVIPGDRVKYECKICKSQFITKSNINYHKYCVKENEKPFKCLECGQGFITKIHFEYHLRTHTGELPYKCPQCGKGFNQRGKVTRHMRSHTGEKPFVCDACGKVFATAQALRSHRLIHTGERPYACKYCNKRFSEMTNLKKHIITHTGERPYICTHCGKSFGLKWTLDLHLRTHSTERPYACDQCTRAFSNSKDLRRHLVIHSDERPFKCWICGTAFRRKDNLDRHLKIHDKAEHEMEASAPKTTDRDAPAASRKIVIRRAKIPLPSTEENVPAATLSETEIKVEAADPIETDDIC